MMLTGQQPFEDENVPKLISKMTLGEFDLTLPTFSKVSKDVKELICKMLDISPQVRPTAKEVLEHSWFKKTDFDQATL
jgi:serine/threonine protein kinase